MNGEQTTVEVVQLAAAAFASFPSSCSLLECEFGVEGFLGRRSVGQWTNSKLGTSCRREV